MGHVNEIEVLRLKIIDLEKQLERSKYQLNESKHQLEEMKELVAKKEEAIEKLKADRLEIDQILLMQVDKNKKLDDAMSKMKLSIEEIEKESASNDITSRSILALEESTNASFNTSRSFLTLRDSANASFKW